MLMSVIQDLVYVCWSWCHKSLLKKCYRKYCDYHKTTKIFFFYGTTEHEPDTKLL